MFQTQIYTQEIKDVLMYSEKYYDNFCLEAKLF